MFVAVHKVFVRSVNNTGFIIGAKHTNGMGKIGVRDGNKRARAIGSSKGLYGGEVMVFEQAWSIVKDVDFRIPRPSDPPAKYTEPNAVLAFHGSKIPMMHT